MLQYSSTKLLAPRYQSFLYNSQKLAGDVRKACGGEKVLTSSLQESWRAAALDFHYMEAIPMGPMVENSGFKKRFMY